jgi:hypothetical protein
MCYNMSSSAHLILSLALCLRSVRDSLAASEFAGRLFLERGTVFSEVGSDTLKITCCFCLLRCLIIRFPEDHNSSVQNVYCNSV